MNDNIITRIEKLEPKKEEAIILYAGFNDINAEEAYDIIKYLENKFYKNTIILAPDVVSLKSWDKDNLVRYKNIISEIIDELDCKEVKNNDY